MFTSFFKVLFPSAVVIFSMAASRTLKFFYINISSADTFVAVFSYGNREKSEAIVFFTAKKRSNLPVEVYIIVAGRRIQPSSCVCNLGVQFDSNMKMEHQIANTVKSCYYQIRNIGRIRPHLTEESCKTVVHEVVTSRLN